MIASDIRPGDTIYGERVLRIGPSRVKHKVIITTTFGRYAFPKTRKVPA